MNIDLDATYRDGAIYPDSPLNLPENTPIHIRIVPKTAGFFPDPFPTDPDEVRALRPQSPKITPEEFDALVKKYSVSVESLPPDFSREDIYSEHD